MNWIEHILYHIIAFCLFTLPILVFLGLIFVHPPSWAAFIAWGLVGSAIAVVGIGLAKFGVPW